MYTSGRVVVHRIFDTNNDMTRCVVKLTSNIQDPVQADRMIDENYYYNYVDGISFTYMHAIKSSKTHLVFLPLP